MLKLNQITKVYEMGDTKVEALKGVSLCFRNNEFVSILGQSGCGKTTMLNIIGGLDRYTNGDLVINGKSTKEYKDNDWDTYRNHSIGFVFQSYNLIPHQTVLENVELALTLSGVSREERKKRAIKVLEKVGLGDKLKNKPSQLSGGQMQRVAIARALVNDPEIILADEPTGALDTETSVQIMELLKDISKDKLIIMVTHNPELAEQYSTRIVRLLDGNVVGDTAPYSVEEEGKEVQENLDKKNKKLAREEKQGITQKERKKREKKKKMSFWTALSLSFKNLLTKKARTILVAFAGSIGIIGIALILAVSSGFSTYINKMQEDTLSTYPITIQSKKIDFTSVISSMFLSRGSDNGSSNDGDKIYANENISGLMNSVGNNLGTNNLEKFYKYINAHKSELDGFVNAIGYTYDLSLEVYKSSSSNLTVGDYSDFSANYNVEPNSNAVMQMVTIYALKYFEDKTGIWAEKTETGYILHRPTDVDTSKPIEEQYPFIYDNNYTSLEYIAEALKTSETYSLPQTEILNLVFAVMGFGSTTSMGSSSFSMLGNMSIFNEMIDNLDFVKSQYDLLGTNGKFVSNDKAHANEAMLVLDKNSELDDYVLYAMGLLSETQMETLLTNVIENKKIPTGIDFDSVIGTTYKVLDEIDYFVKDETMDEIVDFRIYAQQYESDGETLNSAFDIDKYKQCLINAYNNCENTLTIVGVVRLNETSDSGALTSGVAYTKYFTEQMVNYRNNKIQAWEDEGKTVSGISKINLEIPSTISFYINSFDSKDDVKKFIETYNAQADKNDQITYTDYVDLIMSTVSTIINAITYVLIAFVSVSLVVSSIMIGIITYISVIERTKEIGVLRSVGASKKDIKRVFTAESFIIGLASGLIGIGVSLLLILPINLILKHFTGIGGLAQLPLVGSIVLVLISVGLTFIAGLIPAKSAAKKDPVIALREN